MAKEPVRNAALAVGGGFVGARGLPGGVGAGGPRWSARRGTGSTRGSSPRACASSAASRSAFTIMVLGSGGEMFDGEANPLWTDPCPRREHSRPDREKASAGAGKDDGTPPGGDAR